MKRFLPCLLLAACTAPPAGLPTLPAAPAGATLLHPAMTGMLRGLTISLDRKRAAYAREDLSLHVATFGGAEVALPGTHEDPIGLAWVQNGEALVYETAQYPPFPGPSAAPAQSSAGFRLMRVRLAGGDPEVLAEFTTDPWFTAAGNTLVYGRQSGGEIKAIDLTTMASRTLDVKPGVLSPSGTWWASRDDQRTLRVSNLQTNETTTLPAVEAVGVNWIDDDRLLGIGGSPGQRLQFISRTGQVTAPVSIDVEPGSIALPGYISPDGKYALAGGKGKDPGAPLVELATGHVTYTNSFTYIGWLDASTLIARYQDGAYAVPLARALGGH